MQAYLESIVPVCGERERENNSQNEILLLQRNKTTTSHRFPFFLSLPEMLAPRLTSVIQPFADGLCHVEREPLPLRPRAHHLAVDVALRGGRQVLVTQDLREQSVGTSSSSRQPQCFPTHRPLLYIDIIDIIVWRSATQ